MNTSNPAIARMKPIADGDGSLRLNGVAGKLSILLVLAILQASWVGSAAAANPETFPTAPFLLVSAVGGLLLGVAGAFLPRWAALISPLYAVAQGTVMGLMGVTMEAQYPGIAVNALVLTAGVAVLTLLVYAMGWITVTHRLRTGILIAMGAILLTYIVDGMLRLMGHSLPMIHDSGALGIGISLAIVAVAAGSLLIDFDAIAQWKTAGAPRDREWYAAFSLMVTLVWLYVEILNLLRKLRD